MPVRGSRPLGDVLRGLDLAVRQLGVLVQVTPPLDQLGLYRGQQGIGLCGQRPRRLSRRIGNERECEQEAERQRSHHGADYLTRICRKLAPGIAEPTRRTIGASLSRV
jgi:hypothetical protein